MATNTTTTNPVAPLGDTYAGTNIKRETPPVVQAQIDQMAKTGQTEPAVTKSAFEAGTGIQGYDAALAASKNKAPEMVSVTDKSGNTTNVSKADWDTNQFYKNEGYKLATPTGTTPTGTTPTGTTPTGTGTTPTSTSATTTTDTSKKINQDIDTYLTAGYFNTADIATKLGVDQKVIDDAVAGNETLSYKLNLAKNNNKIDEAFVNYKTNIDKIINGTFELNDTEKSQLAAVQAQFDRMRADQLKANQNYEGTIQAGEIRSGRQEFMNQISSGIYKQAIDDGVQKITDIEQKAAATISEMKTAIADKKYKQVSDLYGTLSKYLDSKSTAINDLHKATLDAAKAQQDAIKSDLENTKLNQEIAKTTIEGLTPSLAGADDETISNIASYYKIDPMFLKSSVEADLQKTDKEMAAKGFRTINPADASRMRAEGNEVQIVNGRAYMKEPELKSVTNKGIISFYKGTKLVSSSGIPGGGPASGATADEKEIKAFNDDIKDVRQKIASGTLKRPAALKYVMAQYGLTPENAATLLPE